MERKDDLNKQMFNPQIYLLGLKSSIFENNKFEEIFVFAYLCFNKS